MIQLRHPPLTHLRAERKSITLETFSSCASSEELGFTITSAEQTPSVLDDTETPETTLEERAKCTAHLTVD